MLLDETCPQCREAKLVMKDGRFGAFTSCSNYPKCKYIKPKTIGVPCPKPGCGGELIERRSKRGKVFYGCSKYPECDFVLWNKPFRSSARSAARLTCSRRRPSAKEPSTTATKRPATTRLPWRATALRELPPNERFDDSRADIAHLFSLTNEYRSIKYDLRNIQILLERLGNPHQSFRSMLIAGTNGKGSVAAMLSAMMPDAGLYTSPHLQRLNERFRIGSAEISDRGSRDRLRRKLRRPQRDVSAIPLSADIFRNDDGHGVHVLPRSREVRDSGSRYGRAARCHERRAARMFR